MDRRRFIGVAGVSGAVALAGCLGGGGGEAPTEPEYNNWFANVDNFDGFEDYTNTDEVTVAVGAGDEGWLFDPPAIGVSPGTTVSFEWTGEGSSHNVEAENRGWANPNGQIEEEGHTWERTFENAGTHRYKCRPHENLGMKGAIFVDEPGEYDYPDDTQNGDAVNGGGNATIGNETDG